MFKKRNPIDIAFLVFIGVFIVLSVFELIRFIIPYYSFMRAGLVVLLASGIYVFYKNNFNPKNISNQVDIDKIHAGIKGKISYLRYHSEMIFYVSFVLLASVILVGMLLNTGDMISLTLGIFACIFVLLKFVGFTLDLNIKKSDVSSANTIRFFLLTFALFFIIMKLICDSFAIALEERTFIYIGFSLIYLIAGFITFFSFTLSPKGFLRPYNIMSGVLVLFLVGLLGYNNGLGNVLQEKLFPEVVIVEEMNLPGIISDEVAIIEQEPSEVEYQKVLVADEYDIEAGLSLGSLGTSVSSLQTVLGNLQYFIGDVSGSFDEDTRLALTQALITECEWPESTRGIFGPQAKECIDSLEISIPKKQDNQGQ